LADPKFRIKVVTINTGLNIRSFPAVSAGNIVGSLSIGEETDAYETNEVGGYLWYRIGEKQWVAGENRNENKTYAKVTTNYQSQPTTDTTNTNAGATNLIPETTATTVEKGSGIDTATISNVVEAYKKTKSKIKFDASTKLFAIPHQFTSSTDVRVDQTLALGRKFTETIISEAPIITIIPGKANYLPDSSQKEKDFLDAFFKKLISEGDAPDSNIIERLFQGEGEQRYFGFLWDYFTYMRYVNLLCGATAIMLGLNDSYKIDGVPYYQYNWANYKFSSRYKYPSTEKIGVFGKEANVNDGDAKTLFEQFTSDLTGNAPNYVQFYFDPSTSFGENMGNNTTQSMIAGAFDKAEGLMKELAFLSGTAATKSITGFTGAAGTKLQELRSKLSSQDNVLTRILSMGSVTLTGGNLVFPEIWSDSSYSKSYNVSIHLTSPYGSKEAIFLNIMVPLMHLVALTLPRQQTANSFMNPFLIKAFAKGMFNCEMGIVDSIGIDKGGSGDSWSADGLPTEVRVSLGIKDLYSNLSVTQEQQIKLFFQNQSLIEFLATTCGVDLIKPDLAMKVDLIRNLAFNYFSDLPRRAYEGITSSIKDTFFNWWIDLTRFTRGGQ
jgi:hypothetical protein